MFQCLPYCKLLIVLKLTPVFSKFEKPGNSYLQISQKIKTMKAKNLHLLFICLLGMWISQANAQVTLVESFNYSPGDLDGWGAVGNGWGSAWTTGGGATTANVIADNLYPADAGKSIVIDSATANGAWSQMIRTLETTWGDSGTTYWVGFYVEMIDKAKNSWWALQLNLNADEKVWFGSTDQSGKFGFHTSNGIDGISEIDDAVDTKAWLVLKMQMNGDNSDTESGLDSLFMFVNPDPSSEPDISQADAMSVTGALNMGFNNINLWSDGHYTIGYDRIVLTDDYSKLGISTVGVSKIANKEEFKIYPTVSTGDLNINYTNDRISKINISVYSMTGQKVQTLANAQNVSGNYNQRYNVSNLSNGVYILRLTDGDAVYNRKFVVKK
jgi:hypothetical protein